MADMLTPDMLHRLLRYEPETGKLFWRERPVEMFKCERDCNAWNARFAGKEAFTTTNSDGYKHSQIWARNQKAHRVIWAMTYGVWPGNIDHIDGDRTHNKLRNLREATKTQNAQNKKVHKNNKTGLKGVSLHRKTGKWLAQIMTGGNGQYLGLFDTPEEAHEAYCAAAQRLHGEFYNNGTRFL